jgi:hypothetical protein
VDTQESDLKNSTEEERGCSCINCKNKATKFLQIVSIPSFGYFCDRCASDLKWHGIAVEKA